MSYIGSTPFTAAFLTDTFSGDGSDTTFTLSAAPANTSSIIVAVTGVLQDPSTYSVSGTTLTFSAAPPSGTNNISVRFLGIPASGVTTTAYRTVTEFTATSGQTTFSVPSYTVGYVDVYRNGVMLGTADFTASSGTTIVLASGATAGDLVRVESFYVSSVLNAIPAVAGAVNSTYLNDGAVTQAKLGTVYQNTGPAFHVYNSSAGFVTLTNGVTTKVILNAAELNVGSAFDTTTNYRFTPQIAGYYFFNGSVQTNWATGQYTRFDVSLVKNGSSEVYRGLRRVSTGAEDYGSIPVSGLLYLNGSTDYVELYVYTTGGTSVNYETSGTYETFLSGFLVRGA